MKIEKIGVVGAGQMGSGIAQVAAGSGFQVICFDINQESITKAKKTIQKSSDKLLEKQKITQKIKNQINNIHFTSSLKDLSQTDFVIEAVSENENLKKEIFSSLDKLLKQHAIICSNTSSISITKIASFTKRPSKVAGMHFMNPVPLMKLVEIIRGLETSDETFNVVKEISKKLDKIHIESKDAPGFVVNRILMPMINEAFYALSENLSSASDIDAAMKLGTNMPMGPLTLADFIGLDTCLYIMRVLQFGLGESKRPCPLLVKYVEAGWLGKKTLKGVFTYDK